MTIPLTIVAGFLGAGKTTLVNRLLADAPQRLAVLVNDFAALDIDAALLESSAPGRIALTNGCVCCTLRDDLLAAAVELASADPPPERIVVETSGVAEPYGVMEAFFSPLAAGRVAVDSSLCVVDAQLFPALDYASGERAIDQAAVSDIVLLNKCDLVDEAALRDVEQTLLGAQPSMRIVRTVRAHLPWPVLLAAELSAGRDRAIASATHPHDHGADYASFAWRSAVPLALAAFERFVADLPRGVLRAKGIVRFAEHPGERAIFQLVGKRSSLLFEISDDASAESRIVCIGPTRGFDRALIAGLFAALARQRATEDA